MTVLSPKIARQAYRRGYSDHTQGKPIDTNPYKPRRSADSRWDYWRLGWNDAEKGKQSRENEIDYEWLISSQRGA